MDITNAAVFHVLAEKGRVAPPRTTNQSGAAVAGSRRRPFPWVGDFAPLLSSSKKQEVLGVSATLVAIVVAALI